MAYNCSGVGVSSRLAIAALIATALLPLEAAEDLHGEGYSDSVSHANNGPVEARDQTGDYVLQAQDLLKVEVFQEADLERQVRLSQDCRVTLPLIGTIDLTGKTVQQAQDLIRRLYDRDYLVNPQINLLVLEYAKHDVKVLGQVDKAGPVDIPTDRPLKILDAIALAGGFTRLADRRHITLTRLGADGKTITSEINVDDILQSRNPEDSALILRQGDVIFVPERVL